jgi:hypothetical protein
MLIKVGWKSAPIIDKVLGGLINNLIVDLWV